MACAPPILNIWRIPMVFAAYKMAGCISPLLFAGVQRTMSAHSAILAGMPNIRTVENNGADWHKILRDFYDPFEAELKEAEEKIERVQLPQKVADIQCEKCGAMMVYKQGRYGEFLACPNFPECRNTKAIVKAIDTPCPNCGGRIIIKKGGIKLSP